MKGKSNHERILDGSFTGSNPENVGLFYRPTDMKSLEIQKHTTKFNASPPEMLNPHIVPFRGSNEPSIKDAHVKSGF